jgi:hypothetical protein
LAGIRLNGSEWLPGGEAKQDGIAGWGVSTGKVACARVLESKDMHQVGSARRA